MTAAMAERVVLIPRWWLHPWKQVRILAGNLDACREATERLGRQQHPSAAPVTLPCQHCQHPLPDHRYEPGPDGPVMVCAYCPPGSYHI